MNWRSCRTRCKRSISASSKSWRRFAGESIRDDWRKLCFRASAFLTKERVEGLRKDFDELEANFEELVDLVNELNVRVARIEEREGLQKERVDTSLERFQLQVERFELRLRQLPPS